MIYLFEPAVVLVLDVEEVLEVLDVELLDEELLVVEVVEVVDVLVELSSSVVVSFWQLLKVIKKTVM